MHQKNDSSFLHNCLAAAVSGTLLNCGTFSSKLKQVPRAIPSLTAYDYSVRSNQSENKKRILQGSDLNVTAGFDVNEREVVMELEMYWLETESTNSSPAAMRTLGTRVSGGTGQMTAIHSPSFSP